MEVQVIWILFIIGIAVPFLFGLIFGGSDDVENNVANVKVDDDSIFSNASNEPANFGPDRYDNNGYTYEWHDNFGKNG